MLLTVAWSIQSVAWVEGLDVLGTAVIAAVITGLVLARIPWMPSLLAHGWGLVLGMIATLYLATFSLATYHTQLPVEDMTRLQKMALIRDGTAEWLTMARASAPAGTESGLVFILATTLLVWLLSYVCVRFLVRYVSFWGATLPSGFALLANLYYAPDTPATFLVLFLLCALLLAVRTSVTLNQDYWQRAHIPYSPDIGLDFLKDGVVVVVAVLAIGWLAPAEVHSAQLSSVVTTVTRSSADLQSELNRLFPALNVPLRGEGGAYTDSMPLSGAISLGTVPIFDARIEGPVVPRYFRMAVFDSYDGSGWRRTGTTHANVDGVLPGQPYAATVPVTQTIETFQSSTAQLFMAPQPAAVSVATRLTLGPGDEHHPDVLAVEAREPLAVGGTFQAISRHSTADVSRLRASSALPDPDWVTARYLQLPDSAELVNVSLKADELVADATNRYDAAERIERWLRQFPYEEQINTPPEGRDKVAWFLFEEQRGYCDYYSSSFVVMARSVGIPARVAAGYSRGLFSQSSMAYRQHAYDAHSWPEVFFPELGWVEFEPTAREAIIDRPMAPDSDADDEQASERAPDRDELLPEDDLRDARDPLDPADEDAGGSLAQDLVGASWFGRFAGLMTGLGVVAVALRVAWIRPLRGLSTAEAAFARLVRIGGWVGLRRRHSDTPFEYGRRLGTQVPEARTAVDTITAAFVAERFAADRTPADSSRIAAAWAGLRAALMRFGARRGLRTLFRRHDSGG